MEKLIEKTSFLSVPCYRIKKENVGNSQCFDYDNEPKEVAHFMKSTKRWQITTKEKGAVCSIKKGDLVLSEGYLYGSKNTIKKHFQQKKDDVDNVLVQTIIELVESKVFTKKEGMERLLRHVSEKVATSLL